MPDQVPVQVARERNRVLRDLAAEKKLAFMRSFVGETISAITLNLTHSGTGGDFTEALTDNYLKLHLQGRYHPNRWLTARIQRVQDATLVGTISS